MSLVADYGTDSDSSASSDENNETLIKAEIKTEALEDGEEKKTLPNFKLPAPKFRGEENTGDLESTISVFLNPFLEAENAKEAILQKHVKMIDTQGAIIINGKKICWNYRKGRCRFGHNCKYAHDSDIQKSKEQLKAELEIAKAQSVICHSGGSNSSMSMIHSASSEEFEVAKEASKLTTTTNYDKKRKRPGLSQGLVPGKRVMKQYLHNKS